MCFVSGMQLRSSTAPGDGCHDVHTLPRAILNGVALLSRPERRLPRRVGRARLTEARGSNPPPPRWTAPTAPPRRRRPRGGAAVLRRASGRLPRAHLAGRPHPGPVAILSCPGGGLPLPPSWPCSGEGGGCDPQPPRRTAATRRPPRTPPSSTGCDPQPPRRTAATGSRRCSRPRSRCCDPQPPRRLDRKSTRLNSSHVKISYAVFCLKKKKILAQRLRNER